jgi:hypothetical protein
VTEIPIPPPQEPLITDKETSRANDNWWRYWDATNKQLDALSGTVSSLPVATTYAQTILASTTASVARTALGLGTLAVENYAEGSWTPEIAVAGSTTGITYGSQAGSYIRTANQATVWGRVVLTSNGAGTGDITIVGLPFAATTVAGLEYAGSVSRSLANNNQMLTVGITTASTGIIVYAGIPGSTLQTAADEVDFPDTGQISFSISYRTSV